MNAVAKNPEPTQFIDNGDGTVSEPARGLQWTKATLCEEEVDHATAERLCAELNRPGSEGWRLPTVEELFALADRSRHGPAIDTAVFPDTKSDWYWTSTIAAWSSGFAWFVYFHLGLASGGRRGSDGGFVRAVRSVPAGQ